jgi:Homeodomain
MKKIVVFYRMFKECPHPDEKQRMQLSREVGLDPRQIKFWFQNRRTQLKVTSFYLFLPRLFVVFFKQTVIGKRLRQKNPNRNPTKAPSPSFSILILTLYFLFFFVTYVNFLLNRRSMRELTTASFGLRMTKSGAKILLCEKP